MNRARRVRGVDGKDEGCLQKLDGKNIGEGLTERRLEQM